MLLQLASGLQTYAAIKLLIPYQKQTHPFLAILRDSQVSLQVIPVDKEKVLDWLRQHLEENQCDIILTGKVPDDVLILKVLNKLSYKPAFYSRIGTNILQKWREKFYRLKWLEIWQEYRHYQKLFSVCQAVFAVNHGVAKSVKFFLSKAQQAKVFVVPNPTLPNDLTKFLSADAFLHSHPWLAEKATAVKKTPLLVAVGRLSKVKNFGLLLKAFAKVRERMPVHLWLIGEGKERGALERLARRLQIIENIEFIGFVDNVFAYLQHADALVLTSLREGSPNVLIEALALGVPVVATDCPSGPREILQAGKYGHLVPVNDVKALSNAIFLVLSTPKHPDALRQAAWPYTLARSAAAYWQVLSATDNKNQQ